jgi:hypothetical protein
MQNLDTPAFVPDFQQARMQYLAAAEHRNVPGIEALRPERFLSSYKAHRPSGSLQQLLPATLEVNRELFDVPPGKLFLRNSLLRSERTGPRVWNSRSQ